MEVVLNLTLFAIIIVAAFFDIKERRIPNWVILFGLIGGIVISALQGSTHLIFSIAGFCLGIIALLISFAFSWMGAGDVKLFAAIGSVTGAHLVLPTFFVVVITGGVLALISILRSGIFKTTMFRVLQIFVGLLPGWQMPKFSVPADRRLTIPYGVAITVGAIISTAIFKP